jgi:hypothetical protein
MEVNSNLLRLKLDMVYRDLTVEVAQPKFIEMTTLPPIPQPSVEEVAPAPAPSKVKAKRKKLLTNK